MRKEARMKLKSWGAAYIRMRLILEVLLYRVDGVRACGQTEMSHLTHLSVGISIRP